MLILQIGGFSCVCPENYYGRYCSEKKPLCSSTVCANGASCQETVDGPVCSCKAGFGGTFCERTIDVRRLKNSVHLNEFMI